MTSAGELWGELGVRQTGDASNGRTGWVPRHALGDFRFTDKHLKVNTRTGYATYFVAGVKRWQFPVGTGAPGTPTPAVDSGSARSSPFAAAAASTAPTSSEPPTTQS